MFFLSPLGPVALRWAEHIRITRVLWPWRRRAQCEGRKVFTERTAKEMMMQTCSFVDLPVSTPEST
jgi:hypothetical protein